MPSGAASADGVDLLADGAMQVEAAERLNRERRKRPRTKTGTLWCQFRLSVPRGLC